MGEISLHDQEREVEVARAKLTADLALLRAPQTFESFKDDLKQEAIDTKDAILQKTKASAQSMVSDLVEDLKAKAAANPAAALAIGAGLAWRLLRNPPVASALVGVGLFSLLRTPRPPYGSTDYLHTGAQRLKEQGSELVTKVSALAGDAGQALSEQASELSQIASDKVQAWTGDAREIAGDIRADLETKATNALDAGLRASHDLRDKIKDGSANVYAKADRMAQDAVSTGRDILSDDDSRNKLLLGVAGAAVAAALGIAYQKRIAQQLEDV